MKTRREVREQKRLRSRRIRAVLAGGLVFGVGAAMTLAAWNDSEFATSTFTSGTFDIEGSVSGTTFVNYTVSGSPASLNFQLAPTAMGPGQTTYALFSVRTTTGSVAGDLALVAGTPTGTLGQYLTYGVRTINGIVCNESAYVGATVLVADGSPLGTSAAAGVTQEVYAGGQNQVNYCFAVTMNANAPNGAQNQTVSQTWEIHGTSS